MHFVHVKITVLQVPIVILAEDGVTSLRYYVSVTRDLPSGTATEAAAAAAAAKSAAAKFAAAPGEPSPAQVDKAIAESPLSAIFSNLTKVGLLRS